MAHGTPDWGVTQGSATIHRVEDLGEAAVRLWSPDRFDRLGDVMHMESWEWGFDHWIGITVGGGSVYLSNTVKRTGDYSLHLHHDGSGAAAAGIQRYFSYPVLSRFGVECSFTIDATIAYFRLIVAVFNGATLRTFEARYDAANTRLQLLDQASVYQTALSNALLVGYARQFHTLKLVADYSGNVTSRLLLDERETAPAIQPVTTTPAAAGPYVSIEIRAEGKGGAVAGGVNLDDVILTQNEP